MKVLVFFLIFFSLSSIAHSQLDEFSLSYSPMSVYKLGHNVEEGLTETNHTVLGAITFDYYHYINDRLKLGLSMMFDQEKAEGIVNSGPITKYEKTNSVFVFAPQADFEYLNKNKIKFSSGIGVGYAFNKQTATEQLHLAKGINGFTLHLNLISFRWGINYGMCGNVGLGYKGFVGLGYFVRI